MTEKKLLYEVSIIRPLIIALLVILHSFTIYSGAWPLPEGIEDVSGYYWFCRIISGFRIEMIAMVAGYVFSYQSMDLNRHYDFVPFVIKKAKRLIVPCLVFSCIYFVCFHEEYSQITTVGAFIVQIFSGVGHLWFLPMLFWCFVSLWLFDKLNLRSWILFALLAVLSMLPIPASVPFGLYRFPHFLFYCYFGYMLYAYRTKIAEGTLSKTGSVVTMFVVYLGLILLNEWLTKHLIVDLLVEKVLFIGLSQLLKLLLSCIGIMALYALVVRYVTQPNFALSHWVIDMSQVCYGVYVFHQFILNTLYYYTQFPQFCGSYLLPWVALIVTLVLAFVMTKLFLLTKTGRYLIG